MKQAFTKDYTVRLILFPVLLCASWMLVGCSQQPDQPVILEIEGEQVYMHELEQFARVALSRRNIQLESPEGQKRFEEIAPNLYNSLIDFYVWKYAAEKEGIEPDPAKVDEQFKKLKSGLQNDGQYERFLGTLGLDEDGLRESIQVNLATEILRNQVFESVNVEITESEIKDYYYQNHLQFRHPRRMRASHIYIAAKQDEGPEPRKQAENRAEQLRKMVGDNPGDTFVGLARRYSEDPYSSSRGGDLGFFDYDDTQNYDPAFLKRAFALKEGEVSDVVETPIGYHIIWATDHEQSLEEAKSEIKKQIEVQEKKEAFEEWMKETRRTLSINRLFDPETLEVLENK